MHSQTVARTPTSATMPVIAVGCGALAVATAVWLYWLVIPGALLGIVALVLGARLRRHGNRPAGAAAVALGIAALLLVPSVLHVTGEAENWGRDCALYPSNPDC